MDKKFSVMDMVDDYTNENNISAADIFNKVEEPAPEPLQEDVIEEIEERPKKERDWNPDASLLEDLPELKQTAGAVYDKSEIRTATDSSLQNITDEMAKKDAVQAMGELQRKEFNIEEAKKRRGYVKLQIPPGELQTRILIAASDPAYDKAQKNLDALFDEIEQLYPDMILERIEKENKGNTKIIDIPKQEEVKKEEVQPVPEVLKEEIKEVKEPVKETIVESPIVEEKDIIDETKIIIDKSALPTIAWNEEEIKKIRKSRSIELNIVERDSIEIGEIEELDVNMVDVVLAKHHRKTNDVVSALPASKYRATFTGLTYPEVFDLTAAQDMNSLDGEWKKWSICFDHMKNPSIGEFEEYYIYNKDGKEYKVKSVEQVPDNIQSHHVTKFEDFLRKTSYIDLEFMLWKILCATTRDQEILGITCHAVIDNTGKECRHTYDWVYSPSELISLDEIRPFILEEMKQVGEASSTEEIMKAYKSSSINTLTTVKLVDSEFIINVGHANAYDYLTKIYSLQKSLDESLNQNDTSLVSKTLYYSSLVVIRSILIPKDGKYMRVSSIDGIVKILSTLDEVDWQIISEIVNMSTSPYQFNFRIKNLVCPKCKSKSSADIESMADLLFIIAQSLSSVQVTLKKD
jgi:uncharacterized protein PF11_0207